MPIFECSRCNDMTYSAHAGAGSECLRCGSVRLRCVEGAFEEARRGARELCPGDHATVVFDEPGEIAATCARFLEDGIVGGERVLACVSSGLREAVEDELRAAAPDVEWQDPGAVYADFDADRVAAGYDDLIANEPRTTRILAGVDMECLDGVEPEQFDRYERAGHEIIIARGATVLCAYDASSLSPELLEVGARRHSLEYVGGAPRRNERFQYTPA